MINVKPYTKPDLSKPADRGRFYWEDLRKAERALGRSLKSNEILCCIKGHLVICTETYLNDVIYERMNKRIKRRRGSKTKKLSQLTTLA